MALERHGDAARLCVALMCETRIFLINFIIFIEFLAIRRKNPRAKIEYDVYPCVALASTRRRVGTKLMRVLGTARSSLLQASTRQQGAAKQRIVQRDFADFSWRWNKRSASSLDGAVRKVKRAGLELYAASNPYSGSEGTTHSVKSL